MQGPFKVSQRIVGYFYTRGFARFVMRDNKKLPDTGYEDPKSETSESNMKLWTVKEMPTMLGTGKVLQVCVNGDPKGLLHRLDENEVKWVIEKLSGTQSVYSE